MNRKLLSTALALCISLMAMISVAQAKRLALVLGNGTYKTLSQLSNPPKDAKAIATALRNNGFEVSEYYNLNRADLLDALEDFQDAAKGAELAIVYYAGHGMQIAGKDIIAPTDLKVTCKPKKARRAVGLDKLFAAAGGAKHQIILLDSCRNNPFPQCPTRATQSGSGFRGLSRVSSSGSGTVLIVNATLSGALAADGQPDGHSPFAAALLKQFSSSPKMYFRDLFDQVSQNVRLASRGTQIPEVRAQGGSPRLCLSAQGCAGASRPAAPLSAIVGVETGNILHALGYLNTATPSPEQLTRAIRTFQQKAGLTPSGKASPTLLAVLTTIRLQGVLKNQKVFTGRTKHAVGSTFKDCDDCPQMVVVPSGEFTMGAPSGEPGRRPSEGPAHKVYIKRPFAVSKFEITYDQWQTCTLEGGCKNYRPKDAGWGKGNRPVPYMSYNDAKAYVTWLRQTTGKPYRLLTEAEWEYAARGGTTTAYPTGAKITTHQANFDGSNSAGIGQRGEYLGKTNPVGSYQANPFGLHDMNGNLAEWVEDCWNRSHAGAPSDGTARGGDCARRVVRGGAWYFENTYLRSAARMSFPKSKRLNILGFRIARDIE